MTAVRQCAVLVGGLGTRLGALVADVPKPMLPVAGRPFLSWLLQELSRFGIEEAVLLTGHLSEVVAQSLPALLASLPKPMAIRLSREPVRAGTGGALHHARALLHDRFLLVNGDSFLDCILGPALHAGAPGDPALRKLGVLMLRPVADASRYGLVSLNPDGAIARFQPRPGPDQAGRPGIINGGVYVFERQILDHVTPQCSLEQDVLPQLAEAGRLDGVAQDGWFIDIGIPDDLTRAQQQLPDRLGRPALFLDRDGVCNLDHGWVGTRERFEWVPGAKAAIAEATRRGWHVFIVTNQSGVARGFYTEAQLQALHRWMLDEVLAAGGTIDDWRYCPYHPEAEVAEYRRVSDWRKPAPGMILDLLRAWRLDPARCLFVGDQPTDMQAAAAAGMPGHLFPTGGNLAAFVGPLLDAASHLQPAPEAVP